MKRRLASATFALVAVSVVAATSLIQKNPPSVFFCNECVMRKDVSEWRLAGRWKIFQTITTSATPISELLDQHQAIAAHEHTWSAPRHVDVMELETPDAPRVRSMGLLNAPRAVSFLDSLFSYADSASVESWRMAVWQPDIASALEPALRFARYPENGFESRDEFLQWWHESAFPLFNRLHEMTEAD